MEKLLIASIKKRWYLRKHHSAFTRTCDRYLSGSCITVTFNIVCFVFSAISFKRKVEQEEGKLLVQNDPICEPHTNWTMSNRDEMGIFQPKSILPIIQSMLLVCPTSH